MFGKRVSHLSISLSVHLFIVGREEGLLIIDGWIDEEACKLSSLIWKSFACWIIGIVRNDEVVLLSRLSFSSSSCVDLLR